MKPIFLAEQFNAKLLCVNGRDDSLYCVAIVGGNNIKDEYLYFYI